MEPSLQDARCSTRSQTPAGSAAPAREGPAPARRRAAPGDHRRGVGDRRPPGRRPRRRRADRRPALGVRHPARPADLGRRPPGLSAQDPDRPPRPHPHAAPGRRPVRLHQARRERVRPLRRRAFLHLDLGRPRHGGGARSRRRHAQRRVRDRRRRHERRHGLRGHEQRRRPQRAPDRHPQRQRHVDRAAGRRALELSRPHLLQRHLSAPARHRQAARQAAAQVLGAPRGARRGISRAPTGPAARCSRSWASTTSGPIDGHDLNVLLPVLKNVRDARQGPILVHVVTKKGKGYPPAEASDDKYHGVNRFNVITGAQVAAKPNAPTYTKVFAQSLIEEARKDDKIVAITAAMPAGTGLDLFAKEFPAAHLRRRHRRAARRDVRRRPRRGRLQAVRGHLLDLPAARLRPGRARRRHPAAARALRARPRRAWSAPTARRTPAPSISPISAACRASC